MPFSNPRALLARRGFVTATLTLLLAGLFALGIRFGVITVRDSAGVYRRMAIRAVWLALLDHLPAAAPGLLSRGPLLVLLIVAVVAMAYAIVATLRLPTDG